STWPSPQLIVQLVSGESAASFRTYGLPPRTAAGPENVAEVRTVLSSSVSKWTRRPVALPPALREPRPGNPRPVRPPSLRKRSAVQSPRRRLAGVTCNITCRLLNQGRGPLPGPGRRESDIILQAGRAAGIRESSGRVRHADETRSHRMRPRHRV